QELRDPGVELDVDRLVQTKRGTDALELFRRRIVAGEDCGGVARRQPQQQEHEQGHHAHHGNGSEDAAKQISDHRCYLLPSDGVKRRLGRIILMVSP
ncbi:hypothetical protein chiPu_0033645, partial [Chiloscyllium punctatum]|nr:hypothetical protein [Chiloscyllium punctatum]